ncbi:NADAR family protein [Amycolatopsis orientalis]|uniref:NADAR family protein n=1 Tax=Amycolatopsis orientalis TaxID=31958 RepID=UPI00040C70B4|nr:NADAR family protein [Amycolatopsis orientalis]
MPLNPRSVDEVVRLQRAGNRVKFLFFWGHQPRRDGTIGPECFSQWWPARFTVDGGTFSTAEHYMMWRKAVLFDDAESAARILRARHPREAKALGREVRGFEQSHWEDERYGIVLDGTVAKFGQHPELRDFLLGTKNRVLVEASPLDTIWGIGLAADNPRVENAEHWRGLNLLGFALGEARTKLAPETARSPALQGTRPLSVSGHDPWRRGTG